MRPRPLPESDSYIMTHAISALFAGVAFERHRLIDTSDLDEARERVSRVLSPHQLGFASQARHLRTTLETLALGRVSLSRLAWGAHVEVDPQSLDDYYLLVFPVAGRATFRFDGRQLDVSPRAAVVLSPLRRFHFQASEDYAQVVLRLDRRAVDEAWGRLTGDGQAPPICFDTDLPPRAPGWQALQPMMQWVVRCAGLAGLPEAGTSPLLGQTEAMVATTLLLHQPHSMAARLWPSPPAGGRQVVRQAQDFMLQHLAEALPVSAVAGHCGLSVRRLQAMFQAECGMGPAQWLRQQRLASVRAALKQAAPGSRVAELAMAHGFGHQGEFAAAYREAFGEAPRETLRQRC